MDMKEMLTEQQVATILGVAPSTVARWLIAGRIAHYRMGRFIRVDPKDLNTFIQRSRVEAAMAGNGHGVSA